MQLTEWEVERILDWYSTTNFEGQTLEDDQQIADKLRKYNNTMKKIEDEQNQTPLF